MKALAGNRAEPVMLRPGDPTSPIDWGKVESIRVISNSPTREDINALRDALSREHQAILEAIWGSQ